MGDAPAALNINFGAASGANQLIWDASHGMNGTGLYNVQNFEPGLDTLEFGQHGADGGFHNPAKLARITINGAAYSASNPGIGIPYWNTIPTPNPVRRSGSADRRLPPVYTRAGARWRWARWRCWSWDAYDE